MTINNLQPEHLGIFTGSPITITGDTIMRQAHMTAHDYLMHALSDIDELMGKGAAEKYPQIVAAYLNAAATDCGATIIAQQVRLGLDAIAESINGLTATFTDKMDSTRLPKQSAIK